MRAGIDSHDFAGGQQHDSEFEDVVCSHAEHAADGRVAAALEIPADDADSLAHARLLATVEFWDLRRTHPTGAANEHTVALSRHYVHLFPLHAAGGRDRVDCRLTACGLELVAPLHVPPIRKPDAEAPAGDAASIKVLSMSAV